MSGSLLTRQQCAEALIMLAHSSNPHRHEVLLAALAHLDKDCQNRLGGMGADIVPELRLRIHQLRETRLALNQQTHDMEELCTKMCLALHPERYEEDEVTDPLPRWQAGGKMEGKMGASSLKYSRAKLD